MMKCHKQVEWMSWFDRFDTDESIRQAARLSGGLIQNLENLSTEEACQKLDQAWRTIFVPGPPHVQLLRSLLDQARSFALASYPTVKDYNQLRYSCTQVVAYPQPIRCLTGLAGVGKSALIEAFERICRLQPTAEFQMEGQRLQLYPVRYVKIDGQPAVLGVLQDLANPIALAGRAVKGMAGLMAHVNDWFMATATSTLLVDEMQFFTQSSTASTKTSQLIMTLANLGPPLVYAANFSLVKKLMQRPQEEKDRLLSAPIVLQPPTADDAWWTEVIRESFAVSPETFALDADSYAPLLHRYTAGLYRALRRLLLQAYREARGQGSHVVTPANIKRAYGSRAYSSHRKDVEDLASLAVSSLMAAKRPDSVCPFIEVPIASKVVKPAFSKQQPPLSPSGVEALIESTISVGAKATLRDLREVANLPPDDRVTAAITRLPKRPPISAESLHQGAQVLRDVLKPARTVQRQSSAPQESGDDSAN
ncbi:ATP-binding protein [Chromobacterium subtsugae]|uniref:ATP-binding protein n=1 Tax=Chromobacterium subtsugae TaxID=251747 RepID=UPI000640D165|nr:ATP-binding protein [Chromobacterium subtsugae]